MIQGLNTVKSLAKMHNLTYSSEICNCKNYMFLHDFSQENDEFVEYIKRNTKKFVKKELQRLRSYKYK